jgi:hypothetical protein
MKRAKLGSLSKVFCSKNDLDLEFKVVEENCQKSKSGCDDLQIYEGKTLLLRLMFDFIVLVMCLSCKESSSS